MHGLTLLRRGGGYRFTVLGDLLQIVLVALVLEVGACVGGIVWAVCMAEWGSFVCECWLYCMFGGVCVACVYMYVCVACGVWWVHLFLLLGGVAIARSSC